MTQENNRHAFLANQDGYMRKMGLDETQRKLVLEQDWFGLQAAGCNQYALVKRAGALGVSLMQEGALIRGESSLRRQGVTAANNRAKPATPPSLSDTDMPKIIGGIGTSHAPSMARAFDWRPTPNP